MYLSSFRVEETASGENQTSHLLAAEAYSERGIGGEGGEKETTPESRYSRYLVRGSSIDLGKDRRLERPASKDGSAAETQGGACTDTVPSCRLSVDGKQTMPKCEGRSGGDEEDKGEMREGERLEKKGELHPQIQSIIKELSLCMDLGPSFGPRLDRTIVTSLHKVGKAQKLSALHMHTCP